MVNAGIYSNLDPMGMLGKPWQTYGKYGKCPLIVKPIYERPFIGLVGANLVWVWLANLEINSYDIHWYPIMADQPTLTYPPQKSGLNKALLNPYESVGGTLGGVGWPAMILWISKPCDRFDEFLRCQH